MSNPIVKKSKKLAPAASIETKPSTAKSEIPTLGSRRIRKEWKALNAEVQTLTNWADWLSALYDLMVTPQYAAVKYTKFSSKTGKPIAFSWTPDKNSASKAFMYYGRHDSSLSVEIISDLDSLLKELEKSKLPVLYTTPYKDSVDTTKVRRLVVYRDYVQTGGGHNDSSAYTHALVFAPIVEEHEVLSGN